MFDDDYVRTYGKYTVIYDRGSGRQSEYGDITQLKVGDVVCIHGEEGHQSLMVDKITGSKWTRKIMSKAVSYQEYTLTKSVAINPLTIRRVLRLSPGKKHTPTMEE